MQAWTSRNYALSLAHFSRGSDVVVVIAVVRSRLRFCVSANASFRISSASSACSGWVRDSGSVGFVERGKNGFPPSGTRTLEVVSSSRYHVRSLARFLHPTDVVAVARLDAAFAISTLFCQRGKSDNQQALLSGVGVAQYAAILAN